MINDPRRDPLDPRDPAADPRVGYDPRADRTVINNSGSGRAGLALAAIVAALLVIGFIAFSGGEGVDTTPTASTSDSTVVVPGDDSAPQTEAPAPAEPQQAAPSAPQQDEAPAAAPQDNAPAPNE